jgi:hypothetical protein
MFFVFFEKYRFNFKGKANDENNLSTAQKKMRKFDIRTGYVVYSY